MFQDRFGEGLTTGDRISVDPRFATFSKCKSETGWIVSHFVELPSCTEVVAIHVASSEYASFPLTSVTKFQDIPQFLNIIAPSAKGNLNG